MNIINILKKQFLLFNDLNNYNKYIDFILDNNYIIYEDINLINFSINININKWKFNDNNYKIPYNNDIKLNFIKFNNEENIYDYISSNSLLPDDEIICGENIQNICDIVIGTEQKLRSNYNNDLYSKKLENIELLNDINDYKNIFVFSDNLDIFYNKFNITGKNIISHNSDNEINDNFIEYLDIVNIQMSQNCLIYHKNLISLPIGIENRQYFNHDIFHKIRKNTDIKKEKNIYFNFSINTHFSRKDCYNKLINKLEFNSNKSKEDYFIELKKHKFAICPRGNGLDTHRLWECLYLDVIPIMLKTDFININNLPIILLDSWDDLNEENLYKEFNHLKNSKISLSYYKNILEI